MKLQYVVDADLSVDQHRERIAMVINRRADEIRALAVAGARVEEMASWSLKSAAAAAFRATGAIHALLAAEALAAGEPVDEVVARIETNAASLHALEGAVAGWRRRSVRLVNGAQWSPESSVDDFSFDGGPL